MEWLEWGWRWGWRWRWREVLDPFMSCVFIGTLTGRSCTVAFYHAPSLPHRRKGCCLLPKMMGRVHLHPISEGRFLIREPDFYIW